MSHRRRSQKMTLFIAAHGFDWSNLPCLRGVRERLTNACVDFSRRSDREMRYVLSFTLMKVDIFRAINLPVVRSEVVAKRSPRIGNSKNAMSSTNSTPRSVVRRASMEPPRLPTETLAAAASGPK